MIHDHLGGIQEGQRPGWRATAGLRALFMLPLFFIVACAGSAAIPRSDYSKLEPSDEPSYELRTKDGQVFVLSHFTITPDTIVVHENGQDLSIPTDNVDSIRPIKTAGHGKSFAIGIVALSVFAVVGFLVIDTMSMTVW